MSSSFKLLELKFSERMAKAVSVISQWEKLRLLKLGRLLTAVASFSATGPGHWFFSKHRASSHSIFARASASLKLVYFDAIIRLRVTLVTEHSFSEKNFSKLATDSSSIVTFSMRRVFMLLATFKADTRA